MCETHRDVIKLIVAKVDSIMLRFILLNHSHKPHMSHHYMSQYQQVHHKRLTASLFYMAVHSQTVAFTCSNV